MIFISHRSTDKKVADMLIDFFTEIGISRELFFCSSLPGNDVKERIPIEVKYALKQSKVNIVILSWDYYQSAYCLNEAGIIWYEDEKVVIPIALPEIEPSNMYGFLNGDYKLRRLSCADDVFSIYDSVRDVVSVVPEKTVVVNSKTKKLIETYNNYLAARISPDMSTASFPSFLNEITTDDERIILYFMLRNGVRKASKSTILSWLHNNEIFDVNIDNAFDLLSTMDGTFQGDTLELGLKMFRQYSTKADIVLPDLEIYVRRHTRLASERFISFWKSDDIDFIDKMFVAYIIDEKMATFGDRWMAEIQIENIKQWEEKYSLDAVVSANYGRCLEVFCQYDFIFESGWTSYNNPKEYSLYPSLKKLLFNCPNDILDALNQVKNKYRFELPF